MPNWCSNTATFVGTDVDKLKKLIDDGIKVNDTGYGWLPDFLVKDGNERYLFEICIEDYGQRSLSIRFDSKWAPPLSELMNIASHFKLTMYAEYEELGMLIYGKADYNGKKLRTAELTDEDFDKVTEREDGTYMYEGASYESDYDIYSYMLSKKDFKN